MPCPQTNDVECRICHQMMGWDEDYVHVSYELAPPIGGPVHAQCAAEYRRHARELLDLLDRGNAMLGLRRGDS